MSENSETVLAELDHDYEVALAMVGQWLPDTSGVDFLRACHQLCPAAKGCCSVPTEMSPHLSRGILFLLICADPHSDWLADAVERDPQGSLLTGSDLARWQLDRPPLPQETSTPGGVRRRRRTSRFSRARRLSRRIGYLRRPAGPPLSRHALSRAAQCKDPPAADQYHGRGNAERERDTAGLRRQTEQYRPARDPKIQEHTGCA